MTLIEPIMLVGAVIRGVTGAVWGFGSGIGWAAAGLLVIAMLMALVTKGPRAVLRDLRGMFPRERA
ncbi:MULTISPECIES: hypothetical protein [unclassified Corallococcus]|uniref:hypothetical protein n=1 Tax=unclassified Corallococcus TaxID=2685029 RepID=UPI001A8CCAA1|nr:MULTISPECIES: hypothetical protein [unclassified Corallococcus]MBN9682510.1 hypothetical protein [Corallococcus sp. NCSPR001]WAS85938.1 hypothetical protein O0N60_02965 [Corallococcus sp. NCRR]